MIEKPKRIRKNGTVEDAQRELWRAVVCTKAVLMDPDSGAEMTLKAAHAVQQCISAYVRTLETADLQTQLDEANERIKRLEQAQGLRKVV